MALLNSGPPPVGGGGGSVSADPQTTPRRVTSGDRAITEALKKASSGERVPSGQRPLGERSTSSGHGTSIAQMLSKSGSAASVTTAKTATPSAQSQIVQDAARGGESKSTSLSYSQADASAEAADDSVRSRRRTRSRRSRASGGGDLSRQSFDATDSLRKRDSLRGSGAAANGQSAKASTELPYLAPEQRTFVTQFLNELRSTMMLQDTIANTSPPPLLSHFSDANWTNNVYVNNLPPQTTDDELLRIGKTYGRVKSHKAIINPNTGLCKGYGFIMYETLEEAEYAMLQLPQHGLTASWAKESFTARLRRMADLTTANVYLSNLPLDFTNADLEDLFAPYTIVSMRLLVDPVTRKPKGVGFVRLENRETAQICIDKLHGKILPDHSTPIQVRFADSDAQKQLKQSVRALAGKGDNSNSQNSADQSQAPYLSSPYIAAWAMPNLSGDQESVVRGSNKENTPPNANPMNGFYQQQGLTHPSFYSYVPHLAIPGAPHGSIAGMPFLAQPPMAAANGYYAPHPLGASPLLNPASGLSLSTSQVVGAAHAAAKASTTAQKGNGVSEQRARHGKVGEPFVPHKDLRAGTAALDNAHVHLGAELNGAQAPRHPLESTPMRFAVPIPPSAGKTVDIASSRDSHTDTRKTPSLSASVSSASSLSAARASQSRLASATTPRHALVPDYFVQESKDLATPSANRHYSATHSSAGESFKTGREQPSRGSDGSDSLDVYIGAQAPINIHCPAPATDSHDSDSGSLSKTDSGKDADQRSVTDAGTSISDRNSPNFESAAKHLHAKLAERDTALPLKRANVLRHNALMSPHDGEPMPLSKPATVVPE